MEDPRVAAFIASDQHSKAVEFIDGITFRGLDPNNTDFALLNKFTEAESSNQVINTIAFATGKISFDDLHGKERNLETGDVNLTEAKFKRKLETLIGQLPVGDSPRYRFVLIPLALGMQPKKFWQRKKLSPFENTWEANLSLLIKTQSRAGDNCYVDMSGRVYQSFRKFLKENKFPLAVLCYPSDGAIELDPWKHVKLSYAVVGEAEVNKETMGTAVNLVAGLSLPFFPMFGTVLFAMYTGFRGGMELVDCYQHETMNPLKFPHTIVYWAKVVMCFGYLMVRGMQFFKSLQTNGNEKKICTQLEAGSIEYLLTTTNIGLSAFELMTQEHSWSNMMLNDRTKLAFSLCFQNRLPPSLENGERLLESGRIAALCATFGRFVTGFFNKQVFKDLVFDKSNSSVQSTVAALLFIARKLIVHNLSVELSEDFVTIKIVNRKLQFQNILRLTSDDLVKLGNLFDQLDGDLSKLPSKLAELFGDGTAVRLLA